jgi:PAS domain-containing protein
MNPSFLSHASGTSDKPSIYPNWDGWEKVGVRDRPQVDPDSTAFYSLDATGLITFYSKLAVEIWGRRPEFGDTYERFVTPYIQYRAEGRYLPRGQSPMNDVLAGKISGVFDAEVHIERPDGTRIVAIVNIAPLVDDKGAIVGAIKSFCEHPLRKRRD